MEEGRSAQVPSWAKPCLSQAGLCPPYPCSPAFPHSLLRPICPALIPSPALGVLGKCQHFSSLSLLPSRPHLAHPQDVQTTRLGAGLETGSVCRTAQTIV